MTAGSTDAPAPGRPGGNWRFWVPSAGALLGLCLLAYHPVLGHYFQRDDSLGSQ